MFIQTEQTPNPATLKFLPGRAVLTSGTADFTGVEDAAGRSPLASRFFEIDGVAAVFFGADFITITKSPDKEWHVLKPAILGVIMEHMTAGLPILSDVPVDDGVLAATEEDSEVVGQIKVVINTQEKLAQFYYRRNESNFFRL
jgi:hypothetical protein